MRLSHSKLSCILSNPMEYMLSYIEGISPIQEKPALAIGSAVHWGIEHNTEDLSEYFESQESEYTRDQLLAEAMVHGYFKHKDEIFDQILTQSDGSKLTLLNEYHELYVTGKLKSLKNENKVHDFVGIIDLLLLTDQGFIIIDYKTSSQTPDWNGYTEQLYKYMFLIQSEFPEVPILKIGIINLKKTMIRQKKTENWEQFLNRMKWEYELNDENYVVYHEFPAETIDKELFENYVKNLSKMADMADMIDSNHMWYINYGAANGFYGKSQFWDIYYHTPDAYLLYKISDKTFDEDGKLVDYRPCVPIDMMVIDHDNVMNHYDKYSQVKTAVFGQSLIDYNEFNDFLKKHYICDDSLLNTYEKISKTM